MDTTAIRKQLGVIQSPIDTDERGIINLSAKDILATVEVLRGKWYLQGYQPFNTSTYSWTINTVLSDWSNTAFCLGCAQGYLRQANIVMVGVFNDTLTETNSPALALQAVLTMALRMSYYDWIPLFDAESGTTMTFFESALIPIYRRGFWAVITIVSIHVVISIIAIIGFITRTQQSLLKNSWQVIAQIAKNQEVSEVLQRAEVATDSEISK